MEIVVVRQRGSGVLFSTCLRIEQPFPWERRTRLGVLLARKGKFKSLNECKHSWLCRFQESLYFACHVSNAKPLVSIF